MLSLRLLAPAALVLAASPVWAEECIDRRADQFAADHKVCVSSVLKPQGDNTYGPGNLYRDGAAAWCEGAPGSGKGEYIRFIFAKPVSFKYILVGNGYTKSKETFYANARARTVRVETDGLNFTAQLSDNDLIQTIQLPRQVRTTSLRVEIVDVYDGDKHKDMCLSFLAPNYEETTR